MIKTDTTEVLRFQDWLKEKKFDFNNFEDVKDIISYIEKKRPQLIILKDEITDESYESIYESAKSDAAEELREDLWFIEEVKDELRDEITSEKEKLIKNIKKEVERAIYSIRKL